jgi:hypothetical protein
MMTEIGSSVPCKWDVRVRFGINTDDSWTLVLDDLDSEVSGGKCETADTGGVK